jgi:hypothetical protein
MRASRVSIFDLMLFSWMSISTTSRRSKYQVVLLRLTVFCVRQVVSLVIRVQTSGQGMQLTQLSFVQHRFSIFSLVSVILFSRQE